MMKVTLRVLSIFSLKKVLRTFLYALISVVMFFNFLLSAVVLESHNTVTIEYCQSAMTVRTLYGDFKVNEPVLVALFKSHVMERIKWVNQYGVDEYILSRQSFKTYTRYEHCVGVWALLRLHGANLEEQVAGLLHDASHTVFSHVGDHWKRMANAEDSYQDSIHEWYLKQQGVEKLLLSYGFDLATVLYKDGKYSMLEQDLPALCADRFEYNLQAGLLTGMLTEEEVKTLARHAQYCDGNWFFVPEYQMLLRKLGDVSLYNTQHVWGAREQLVWNGWIAQALDRALEVGLLTAEDIHFSVDRHVWDVLHASTDSIIKSCIHKTLYYDRYIKIVNKDEAYDMVMTGKFRGLDPFIKTDKGLQRLTELDAEYKNEYERVRHLVGAGWHIKFAENNA